MSKIIQIRGTNGSGKTTIVREFLRTHASTIISITVNGKRIECHKTGEIIVIGRYDKNACGGCDSEIHSVELFKNTIAKIIRVYKPEALIFEAVFYGKTFKFSNDINRFARAAGYDYIALCLIPTFEKCCERVYERNGGNEINIEAMLSTYNSCLRSNAKLRAAGVNVKLIDTTDIPFDKMAHLLENEV